MALVYFSSFEAQSSVTTPLRAYPASSHSLSSCVASSAPQLTPFPTMLAGQPVQIPQPNSDAQVASDLTAHRIDPAKQVLPMYQDRESEFFSLMKSAFVMLSAQTPTDRCAILSPAHRLAEAWRPLPPAQSGRHQRAVLLTCPPSPEGWRSSGPTMCGCDLHEPVSTREVRRSGHSRPG